MLKDIVKRLAYATSPQRAAEFFSARARAHSQKYLAGIGCRTVNEALLARFGDEVVAGPFLGLKLSPMARAEQIGPILLGLYEAELFPLWESIFQTTFSQVIDVGSKFGVYAVGLARRFPDSRIVAFDTDPWARRATREMCLANGAANVEVLSYCDADWLAANLVPGALILSDCEGYENTLFCGRPITQLVTATLVVETHDCFIPGTTNRLIARLAATHNVTPIHSIVPGPEPTVDLNFLSERDRALASRELRQEQDWLFATPKARVNSF
jgi:hypothetical protein